MKRDSMARRHFQALAVALSRARHQLPHITDPAEVWEVFLEEISRVLPEFNKAFDHDRFVKACMEG